MPLADPIFTAIDPQMQMILSVIGGGDPTPKRLSKGVYLVSHYNMGNMIENIDQSYYGSFVDSYSLDQKFDYSGEWTDEMRLIFERMVTTYGVCDTPEQLLEKYDLESFVPKVCVSFCKVVRAEQPSEGGWRWHKWGEYIGTKDPQYEYLYNEKDIDEVYCYHIHVLV